MNSTNTNKAEMRTCIKRNPRKPGRIKGLRGIVHMNGDAPKPPRVVYVSLKVYYILGHFGSESKTELPVGSSVFVVYKLLFLLAKL